MYTSSRDHDLMPCSVLLDLGLHCLALSHKKEATCMNIWVHRFNVTNILETNQGRHTTRFYTWSPFVSTAHR